MPFPFFLIMKKFGEILMGVTSLLPTFLPSCLVLPHIWLHYLIPVGIFNPIIELEFDWNSWKSRKKWKFWRIIEKTRRQSLTFLRPSFGRVSMQCPYILNGKFRPSSILFGDDKVSLKTSVESVEPSFDNPPVIHQDEFPDLAKKNNKFLLYKYHRSPV